MENNTVPKIDIPLDKGDVPLNQPFPKEVKNAPIVELAEQVGQAAVDSSLGLTKPEVKKAAEEQKEVNNKQKESKKRKKSDLLVKILIITGSFIILIGLFILLLSVWLGVIIILLGTAPILFAVFGPLRAPKRLLA
ncbi:MAG: hypothetical protein JWO47_421 [Candidatus Saccharibacteria bacterium]|nr:hypothetical protein [Candidatus Saccharibacteria bacterium]